jgi:hypothetical protein
MTAGATPAGATPEPITNRPALGAVSYRVGRYATFYASMLAALSDQSDPELGPAGALRTRDPGDFSIALLDSWAVTLDTLTFYTERIANEAYLRTAADQRSVTELAALVGYVPSPGVSASATLAFTLSAAPGAPASVVIPAGTRVQSVPGPGEKVQVYETSADLTALGSWNALPAQATVPWSLCGTEQSTWIAGQVSNISVGDALLFVAAPGGTPSPAGPAELRYVTAVQADPVAKATRLTWDTALDTPEFKAGAAMYAFRRKAALFGANAPSPALLSGPNIAHVPGYPGPSEYRWNYAAGFTDAQVTLDAVYPGLARDTAGPPQWLALTGLTIYPDSPGQPGEVLTVLYTIEAVTEGNPARFGLSARATTATTASPLVLLAGSSARAVASDVTDLPLLCLVARTPEITAYLQSVPLTGAPLPFADWTDATQPYPLTVVPFGQGQLIPGHAQGALAPVAGPAVKVTGGQQVPAGRAAGVSGKRMRLQVTAPAGGASSATFTPAGASGGSGAATGQVFLIDAYPPSVDPHGNASWSVLTASGVAGTLLIPAASLGRVPFQPAQFLPADDADPMTGESVVIQDVTPAGNLTTLTLAAPLSRIYDRSTVTVNANAVLATNGETVQEILGSGDPANPALAFTLKQAPLTYLTAPVATGAQSTLQVWVNNLRWAPAPNLLDSGPADRVYTTRVTAAGDTVVQFGDGGHGGRPPTGQANIRAVYRKGTGLAGLVRAGQLSQPLDRPQGLSSVTNPGPASGGADPATADEVRASAPLPTLTISRVVSLQDYQDYALGFAGIAKAQATWTWSGNLRGVLLTVAGANGATLDAADPVVKSLATALRQSGDPHVPLTIAAYRPVRFTFTAAVAVDTTSYAPAAVLAQAWQATSAAFAFGRRSLGQGVAASEVVAVIQSVPGVIAVQVTALRRSGQPAAGAAVLRASGPQPPTGTSPALGAELLVLDPATQGTLGGWS